MKIKFVCLGGRPKDPPVGHTEHQTSNLEEVNLCTPDIKVRLFNSCEISRFALRLEKKARAA